jgi:ribosome maturation factor RimP
LLQAVNKTAIIADVERTLAASLPDVEVVDVEVAGGRGNAVLRVFIDSPEGVNHELCARATGLLDRYLRDHTVEVSSPGLERRLRKPEHFRGAVGKKINVRTYGPVEGQRNFTGFLVSADEKSIVVGLDSREVEIPLDDVASARLVFEFGKTDKPQHKRKKKHRKG